jgi:hypothetical protein
MALLYSKAPQSILDRGVSALNGAVYIKLQKIADRDLGSNDNVICLRNFCYIFLFTAFYIDGNWLDDQMLFQLGFL